MDNYYNSRKQEIYFSDEYQNTITRFSPIIHHPFLSFQKIEPIINNISYRKINIWSDKGIISDHRENNSTKWRKFSFKDVVDLMIITNLREFGLALNVIWTILDKISNNTVILLESGRERKVKFLDLEYNFFKATNGEKTLLVIRSDEESVYFGSERNTLLHYFGVLRDSIPLLILPFYSYVQKLSELSNSKITTNEDTALVSLLKNKQDKTGLKSLKK